jgi:hypothetical protein
VLPCTLLTPTSPPHGPTSLTHTHTLPADDIYRDDITFRDPRNSFSGLKNYQLIFWSLRFHGRIFFKHLYVEVKRIWQPSDGLICMRWTVHGIPRVPWEAEGTFDGISQYKLDSDGKIYEHAGEAWACVFVWAKGGGRQAGASSRRAGAGSCNGGTVLDWAVLERAVLEGS